MKKLISVMLLICLMVMPVATSEEEIVLSDDAEMETGTIELDIADEFSEPIPEDISALDLSEELLIDPEDRENDTQPKENGTSNTGSIAIDESNFPDENFRAYVLEKCDTDSDGLLSDSEISNVTEISVYGKGIYSLAGIEYFTKLTYLNCEETNISELDLNSNTALVDLRCDNNSLTSLNISSCQNLTTLFCRDNNLVDLDIRGNPLLDWFGCAGNKLRTLDLSNNSILATAVREYGPMIWNADSTSIGYIHPAARDDCDGPIDFDRSIKVYANGELLYSPDKPIQRTVKSVTLGAGETDDALLYYKGEKEYDTPYWIRILLSNGDTTYKSSNPKVVKVDNEKKTVKGVKKGKATVTVISSKGVEIKCEVTVKKAPSRVSLSKSKVALNVDEEKYIKVKLPSGTASRNLTWSSSNPAVAEYYDYHGTIRANGPGTATITVKTYNGKKASCKVTVKAAEPTTLTLNTTGLYLEVGETFQIIPTIDEGTYTTFSYSSKNKKIASVSTKGVVKGVKKGTTKITVKTKNGLTKSFEVQVGKSNTYKSGTSGVRVYASLSDKYFHTKNSCSKIVGSPSRVTLETALNYGKQPCAECAASALKTVYIGKGKYYHYKKNHAGSGAKKSTLADALGRGYDACPDCVMNQ